MHESSDEFEFRPDWTTDLAREDLWKLSSDKREVFFLFIAIYCLISTQTYCNQRVKIAGH